MLYTTHLAIGFYLFLMIDRLFPTQNKLLLLGIILTASLLPDIDYAGSFLGRRIKIIGEFFKHRGFIHTIYPMFLFTLLVHAIWQNLIYTIAFAISYAMHLFIDSLTKAGTKPLWFGPRIRGIIKSNSVMDKFLFFFLIIVCILMLFKVI